MPIVCPRCEYQFPDPRKVKAGKAGRGGGFAHPEVLEKALETRRKNKAAREAAREGQEGEGGKEPAPKWPECSAKRKSGGHCGGKAVAERTHKGRKVWLCGEHLKHWEAGGFGNPEPKATGEAAS